MILDGRTLDASVILSARYCVVGTGMGGTAVAQMLARNGEDVLLVEAGNTEPHTEPSPVVGAEHVGRPFGIPLSRCIELGGTSNQWHGICGPLDEIDFEPRPWISGSGWPIRRTDLSSYYEQAATLLEIGGAAGFDPAEAELSRRPELADIELDRTVLGNKIVRFRKPPKRWKDTLLSMARLGQLRCLINATALELITDESGTKVEHLIVGTVGTNRLITADVFIICAGGLETPRLLLNSNRSRRTGLGNTHGLVGSNLLDHPVGHFCKLRFRGRTHAPLYASAPVDRHVGMMAGIVATAASQRRYRLPNHYLWVRPSVSAARLDDELLYSFLKVRSAADLTARQAWAIVTNRDICYRIMVHRFGLRPRYLFGDLFFMTEQLPNASSRVDLSETRKDPYGYPVARVNWQLSAADFDGFAAYAKVLFEHGLRSDQYSIARADQLDLWRQTVASAAHHLGTARMADSPADGVVDRNLQVFGTGNLYVCDGSVFATSGGVNPSLTITALGLRLAAHLLGRAHASSVTSHLASPAVAAPV